MMKKSATLCVTLTLVAGIGCARSPEYRLKHFLREHTDSVEIRLYGMRNDRLDRNLLVEKVTDKNEIMRIIDFITEKPLPRYKCAFHGSIAFLKKDRELLEDRIEFNIHPDCVHMAVIYEGKSYSRKITQAGQDFLRRLYQRLPADARLTQ